MIYGEPVVQFVAAHLPPGHDFGECTAIGFLRDGRLEAGVVYHDWSPEKGRIEISVAATDKRWMTRTRVATILEYPFGFCGLVYARSDNPTVQRTFRFFGGEVFPTPVWTICTLRKEAFHAWKLRTETA